mgnify:CR=1 FL=1
MKKENMRFGTLIKALRTEHEVTLKTMSEVLGISRSMLSDIEQNRRKPLTAKKSESLLLTSTFQRKIEPYCTTLLPKRRAPSPMTLTTS